MLRKQKPVMHIGFTKNKRQKKTLTKADSNMSEYLLRTF